MAAMILFATLTLKILSYGIIPYSYHSTMYHLSYGNHAFVQRALVKNNFCSPFNCHFNYIVLCTVVCLFLQKIKGKRQTEQKRRRSSDVKDAEAATY